MGHYLNGFLNKKFIYYIIISEFFYEKVKFSRKNSKVLLQFSKEAGGFWWTHIN